jgi:hypothetical protein
MRLLFSSIHCYLDPSSGAALCTRELLAARGMDCRVLTTGVLDPEWESSLDEALATLELPARRFQAQLGACPRIASVHLKWAVQREFSGNKPRLYHLV